MQLSNASINYVLESLQKRLNEMDGSRLLSDSHHLRSWLCNTYVIEYKRNNPSISFNDAFDKCYPVIDLICKEKGNSIQTKDLLELVKNKIAQENENK